MGWTTPRTWVTSEVVTASIMNTHVKDNLAYLFSRPNAIIIRDNGATYTTTSTSFVDVDATYLANTISVSSGRVLVFFNGTISSDNTTIGEFDFTIDGTRYGAAATGGITAAYIYSANWVLPVSFCTIVTGLSAGSHTFKLQWRYNPSSIGTNLRLYSGNGVNLQDYLPLFGVLEVA